MVEQRKGAWVTVTALAAALFGFGFWQFGGLGLSSSENHEAEYEHEYAEYSARPDVNTLPSVQLPTMLERIALEEKGRIIEVEREMERGRDVYEIKLVRPDGRTREIKIDAVSGKVIDRD